jgi:hypothetical protein
MGCLKAGKRLKNTVERTIKILEVESRSRTMVHLQSLIEISELRIRMINGYRFFFFSNEGNEARHIHFEKGDGAAKYWLDDIEEVYNFDFSPKERKQIKTIIIDHQEFLISKWDEYFND